MTLLQFFCQDPKKIKEDFLALGLNHSRDLPSCYNAEEKLCELLNVENPDITYFSANGNSKHCTYAFTVKLHPSKFWQNLYIEEPKSCFRKMEAKFFIEFTGKFNVKNFGISTWDDSKPYTVEAVNYHFKLWGGMSNLQITVFNDEADVPFYDNLQQLLDIIYSKYDEYVPYVQTAINIINSGELEKGYNSLSPNPFKYPKDNDDNFTRWIFNDNNINFPWFNEIVKLIKFFKETYNYDITPFEIISHKFFEYKHKAEIKKYHDFYQDYSNYGKEMEKPIGQRVTELDPSFTLDEWKEFYASVNNTTEVERQRKWHKLYIDANTELHFAYKDILLKISEKYNIPLKYIGVLNYNDYTNTCTVPPGYREVPNDVNI